MRGAGVRTAWVGVMLVALSTGARAEAKKPKLAVTDLQVAKGVDPGTTKLLSELMLSEVTRSGRYDAIGSSDVATLIGFERQKQLLGCSENSSCLAEIGDALGAELILTGQIGTIGTRFRVDLKLVNTRTATVEAREGDFAYGEDGLATTVPRLVRKLLASTQPAGLVPIETVEATSGPSRRPAYAVVGGAGALLVLGIGFGLAANGTYSDMKNQRGSPDYPARYPGMLNTLHLQEDISDTAYALSAVAAGVGVWLWLRAPTPVALAPIAGGGQLVARGTF